MTILEYPSARVGTVSEHRLETMNYVHDNSWLGKGESAQHLMPFVIWQRRTIDLIDFNDQETKLRVLPNSGQEGIYRADLSSSYLMYFILSYTYKIIIRKSFILSYTCYSYIHLYEGRLEKAWAHQKAQGKYGDDQCANRENHSNSTRI